MNIQDVFKINDDSLVDLIMKCLIWEAERGITTSQVMDHSRIVRNKYGNFGSKSHPEIDYNSFIIPFPVFLMCLFPMFASGSTAFSTSRVRMIP
jgi:hypothetical protein